MFPTGQVPEYVHGLNFWLPSYIADLTPDMILALAVTVPLLEAPALRDAICKHVSFRSSIRIHIPVGFVFASIAQLSAVTNHVQVPWKTSLPDGVSSPILRVEESVFIKWTFSQNAWEALEGR